MSDDELSAEEQLLKRHRKEKKDLQAKIQNLKKTLSKGDKKKKKEAQEEINQLENDLSKRHAKELESLEEDLIVSDTTKLAERLILDESKTEMEESMLHAKFLDTMVERFLGGAQYKHPKQENKLHIINVWVPKSVL